jgi:serine/threonine protein kinase
MSNGVCKIADFGFAKQIRGSKALTHTILGTPLWMAPEILKRKPYTSKNDV